MRRWEGVSEDLKNADGFGVPYGNRTRVAAVKEKRPIVIQSHFAWLWPISCEGDHEAARGYLQHLVGPIFSK